MSEAITIIGSAMSRDLERLDAVSQNLANVRTDGYKKLISVERGVAGTGTENPVLSERAVDFGPGALKETKNPMDVAVSGAGFLVVKTLTGEAFTRKGNLQLSADGYLQLPTGEVVLGTAGEIGVEPGAFEIKSNGDILQAGSVLNTLRIEHFENPESLAYLGNGLFAESRSSRTDSAAASQIKQGYLETSNVQTLTEMVTLMNVVRHYEASAQVLRAYDDTLGTAINKIGEF